MQAHAEKIRAEKIRATARRLLAEGKVDCFIGFRPGTVPMVPNPVIIHDAAEAEQLCWDSHCALNLSSYLHGLADKRVGLCVTGCSSRNVVLHLAEKQVRRENLYLVGIPCTGMVDPRAVQARAGGATIVEVSEAGDELVVRLAGDAGSLRLPKAEVLQANCRSCAGHNPVLSDELVSEELVPAAAALDVSAPETRFADVAAVEALSREQRWQRVREVYAPCIRCYACRQACPECYCPTCFVDESNPPWLGKSNDPDDTLTFHLLRAFHMAGRCTECGACERACPMDLEVRYLTKKLVKEAHALFGYTAGEKADESPLLDQYRTDDPHDFIY